MYIKLALDYSYLGFDAEMSNLYRNEIIRQPFKKKTLFYSNYLVKTKNSIFEIFKLKLNYF